MKLRSGSFHIPLFLLLVLLGAATKAEARSRVLDCVWHGFAVLFDSSARLTEKGESPSPLGIARVHSLIPDHLKGDRDRLNRNSPYTSDELWGLSTIGLSELLKAYEASGLIKRDSPEDIESIVELFRYIDSHRDNIIRLVGTSGEAKTYQPTDFERLPGVVRPTRPIRAERVTGHIAMVFEKLGTKKARIPAKLDLTAAGRRKLEAKLAGQDLVEMSRFWLDPDQSLTDKMDFYTRITETLMATLKDRDRSKVRIVAASHGGVNASLFRNWGFEEEGTYPLARGGTSTIFTISPELLLENWQRNFQRFVEKQDIRKATAPTFPPTLARLAGRVLYRQPWGKGYVTVVSTEGGLKLRRFDPGGRLAGEESVKGSYRILPERFEGAMPVEVKIHSEIPSATRFEARFYLPVFQGAIEYERSYGTVRRPGEDHAESDEWERLVPGTAPAANSYSRTIEDQHVSIRLPGHVTRESLVIPVDNQVLFLEMFGWWKGGYDFEKFFERFPTQYTGEDGRTKTVTYKGVSPGKLYDAKYRSEEIKAWGIQEFSAEERYGRFQPLAAFFYPGQAPRTLETYLAYLNAGNSGGASSHKFLGEIAPKKVMTWVKAHQHRFNQWNWKSVLEAAGLTEEAR